MFQYKLAKLRGMLHNKEVFIYYASSDTRIHVATSTVEQLIDYCINTPEDDLSSTTSVEKIINLADRNLKT